MKLFIFVLLLLTLACQLPPVVEPGPDIPILVKRDDFDSFSSLFNVAGNPGGKVSFDTSYISLAANSGSGWIFSTDKHKLPGLTIEVGFAHVSEDFALEWSPTLFDLSDNGFYLNDTRSRAYVFDPDHKFHFEHKKAQVLLINQTVVGKTCPMPGKIRLRFTQDSLFYDYFDGSWQNAFAMQEQWQGEWYFSLASRWNKGVTKIDYVEISGPEENFIEPEFGSAVMEWYKNKEADAVKYKAEAVGYKIVETSDNTVTFTGLPKGKEIKFRAMAGDTANNWSEWSNPDTVKTIIK